MWVERWKWGWGCGWVDPAPGVHGAGWSLTDAPPGAAGSTGLRCPLQGLRGWLEPHRCPARGRAELAGASADPAPEPWGWLEPHRGPPGAESGPAWEPHLMGFVHQACHLVCEDLS